MWRLSSKLVEMKSLALKLSARIRIQSQWRRYFHENQYKDYRKHYYRKWISARTIQKHLRRHRCQRRYAIFRRGLIPLQSQIRRKICVRRYHQLLLERLIDCANRLQKWAMRCVECWQKWRRENQAWIERRAEVRCKRQGRIYRGVQRLHGKYHFILSIYKRHVFSMKERTYIFEFFEPGYCTLFSEEYTESQLKHWLHRDLDQPIYHPLTTLNQPKEWILVLRKLSLSISEQGELQILSLKKGLTFHHVNVSFDFCHRVID